MSGSIGALRRVPHFIVTVLAALALAVSLAVVTAPRADAATRGERIQQAKRVALNQIGDPYRYGAAGPDRFDCSGLIYFATHKKGFTGVPRTSSAQARWMRKIPKSAMRPGDFMYFYNSSGVYHAAIFLGWKNGRRVMVNSPGSGQRVQRDNPWTTKWMARTLRR